MTLAVDLGPRSSALRDYQSRTLMALFDTTCNRPAETFTVMFPRQAGKNEISAALVALLLRKHASVGGCVVVCAPTGNPQAAISFDRTRRLLGMTDHIFLAQGRGLTDGATIRVGRASAVYLSASPVAHVAGHTASLALIADEAQDIDADWFNRQFRPMAASTGAPTIMFGTPWDGQTLLETMVAANRLRDARQEGLPYDTFTPFHHEVSWREVAAARPRYGDYVRAERRRLGERHPLFLTQYELRPADGGGRLFSAAQLARLQGTHARLHGPQSGQQFVGGLDFGGQGEDADRTVLTIARVVGARCEVVQHVAWRATPFSIMLAGVIEATREWRLGRLCADATGLGAPLVAQMVEQFGSRVEPFVFSSGSKSDLGYALVAAAETGRLCLYACDSSAESRACAEELRGCRSRLRGHSRLEWEAPPGGHDDYVTSLALCLRAAASVPAPRIAIGRRR